MSKTRKLLQPQFVSKFRCIGSECEDNCCSGWRVNIDKATYQKFRKCPDVHLKEQMKNSVTRNRNEADDDKYAKIKMNNDGSCPFFNEERLCSIQRELGEGYLSRVCKVYPRASSIVNGGMERTLTLSCPEAARLILKNPAVIEFDESEGESAVQCIIERVLTTNDITAIYKAQRYFWELRIFTISTLQSRQYPLWQRLVILGLFYNKLDQLIGDTKIAEIPQLIDCYRDLLNDGGIVEQLNAIPNDITIQMKLMKELTDERFFRGGVSSKRFLECFTDFLSGIKFDGKTNLVEIGEAYAQAYKENYKPFLDKHEYMLENYLVNNVFKNLFPFSGERHIFDSYVGMIIPYAMIKTLLIGMAGFHKEKFSEDHVIKLIQSFSQTVEHDHSFLQHIFQLFKSNKFNTMVYMAILIKN